MEGVIISVSGSHEERVPAQIAQLTVSARLDGPDRAQVFDGVTELGRGLSADLSTARDAGAVTEWSTDGVSVWADRPWNQDGVHLPLVHHARTGCRASFVDVTALSDWIAQISTQDGIVIDSLTWALTPETARETEKRVAQAAVGVAIDRARAYGEAIGTQHVSPTHIADAGLLSGPEAAMAKGAPMAVMSRSMMADAGGGALELEPPLITVSATVDARFAATW